MEQRKLGDVTVNDGGGLMDSEGVIETAFNRLNQAVKNLTGGQYLCFCEDISNIAQMLVVLKDGIRKDRLSLQEQIRELQQKNDRMAEQLTGLPVIRDEEAENG